MDSKDNTTVVIVDEDTGARDGLAEVLRDEGYDCECFSQSLAALSYLSRGSRPADLLVTDSQPEGMGGIELLREVKLIDPRFPVILLSHLCEAALAIEAVRAGADDLLRKPVPPGEVVPLVQKCLRADRLEQEGRVREALRHYISARRHHAGRPRDTCASCSASSALSVSKPCSILSGWRPTLAFSDSTAGWKVSRSSTWS